MASPSATIPAARSTQFWLAALMLTLAVLIWSGTAVTGRWAAGNLPPVQLAFWRWFMAFCIFLPLGGAKLWQARAIVRRDWKWLAALSFFGMGGFAVPYFWGLQYTLAVNAAVLNALGPVMILVIAAVTLGSRVNFVQLIGILLGVGGSLLIVFRGDFGVLGGVGVNIGDILLMLAVFLWSCYTVALRRAPLGLDQFALMAVLSGLTVPMLAPFYWLEYVERGGFELTGLNIGIIVYSGICSSVIAYLCWNRGVTLMGAARAGAAQYLMPVFGAVLAYLILGEAIEWFHWAGMVVIFGGIALSSRKG